MPDFDAAAAKLITSTFDHLGRDASFVTAGNVSTPGLRVTLDAPDVDVFSNDARMTMGDAVVRVAIATMPATPPKVGDKFVIAAQNYFVVDQPRVDDPDRRVWAIAVEAR